MNKGLLNILHIEVLCPKCQKTNVAIVAEIIASPQFDCHFCSAPINVNNNKEIKDALEEFKDFVEYSYKPKTCNK
jgi:hypothetical protein